MIRAVLVGHRSPLGPAPFDETMQARRCVISHHGCGAAPSTIMMLFARRRRSPRVLVGLEKIGDTYIGEMGSAKEMQVQVLHELHCSTWSGVDDAVHLKPAVPRA